MRRTRPRWPKPQEVIPVMTALERFVPMDTRITMGWRESQKLVPNMRVASQTNEKEWSVDIYSGSFYVVTVSGIMETCDSIPYLIGYLCRMLGVKVLTTKPIGGETHHGDASEI